MAPKPLPDQDTLLKLLRYEPETGRLFWRRRSVEMFGAGNQTPERNCAAWNKKYDGAEAFTAKSNGYLVGAVDRRKLYAHRVIWVMTHGEWPEEIDHINGDRTDNRLANLRHVDRTENGKNTAISRRNTSGVMGVSLTPCGARWQVYIHHQGQRKSLGHYVDFDQAVRVRKEAERRYGYHQNHGRASQ